jgi:hypothetical protein
MDMYIILTVSLSLAAVGYSFIKRREIDSYIQNNQNSFTFDAFLDLNGEKPNYYRATQILVLELDGINLRQESINNNDLRIISKSKRMVEKGFVDERMFTKIKFLHSMYTRN